MHIDPDMGKVLAYTSKFGMLFVKKQPLADEKCPGGIWIYPLSPSPQTEAVYLKILRS
jgi:hypothetical protein